MIVEPPFRRWTYAHFRLPDSLNRGPFLDLTPSIVATAFCEIWNRRPCKQREPNKYEVGVGGLATLGPPISRPSKSRHRRTFAVSCKLVTAAAEEVGLGENVIFWRSQWFILDGSMSTCHQLNRQSSRTVAPLRNMGEKRAKRNRYRTAPRGHCAAGCALAG
jgi:hypothetical protein